MSAVLITEAIKARIKNGTFEPHKDDPAYETARRRQQARADGQPISSEDLLNEYLAKGEGPVIINKKAEKAKESTLDEMGVTVEQVMKAMAAIEAAKVKG